MTTHNSLPAARAVGLTTAYILMILGTVVVFRIIGAVGGTLSAPGPFGPSTLGVEIATPQINVFMHVLLVLLVIVVTCRVVGKVFLWLGQPPVIGEMLAGIILGPSLLGRVAPAVTAYLLPPAVSSVLEVLAQFGVVLYMFTVGLEMDPGSLGGRNHTAIVTSHASIMAPFLLGAGLALWAYPRFSTSDVPFAVFALFLGVAMSVTAFPVLARILTDSGMSRSELGVLALTCAAVDDVTAWCLLAIAVGVARAKVGGALLVTLGALGFIALMVLVRRPLTRRLVRLGMGEDLPQEAVAAVMIALLLSAWITEFLGIHAVFGAFLLGALVPHDCAIAHQISRKLRDMVSVLFLPAFFAYTGMRTEIGLVAGQERWLACGLIIVVATVGKFGGTLGAAWLSGIRGRDAVALGMLMNTRGLMELIVLDIGLKLKVISPTLFAMMVLMALATTIATTPILHRLYPRRQPIPLADP